MRRLEYRAILAQIVRNAIRKQLPGLKNINDLDKLIARNIDARMYGANIEGVESPLWRKEKPPIDAKELLEKD